jgi:hypothetical protein
MNTTIADRPRASDRVLLWIATSVTLVLGAALAPIETASAAAPECAAVQPGGPVQVTADCVDPLYSHPVIDNEVDLTQPVVHRKASGHFAGTEIRFNIYLPPANQWKGRFFQYTYPLTDENATDRAIGFGSASGGYTVQAGSSGNSLGYRHAAAAAKFAKTVAAAYYGSGHRRIYGYLYGPSGGSFQTVGAMENTTGVWQGFVPMVIGTPMSVPYNFFIRAMARLVLADKSKQISDAVLPGGSGRPYAGLDQAERAALHELTSFGVPLAAWANPDYLLGLSAPDGLLGFGAVIRGIDPGYANDFWTLPGYLGTEDSALGDVFRAALVESYATVAQVDGAPPTQVTLTGLPAIDSTLGLDYTVYLADGTTKVGTLTGTLDAATGVLTIASGNSAAVLDALVAGAQVRVDNRWDLALRAYYRYQLPPAADDYHGFDQFRGSDGQPLYPQRPLLIGPLIANSTTGGATYSGHITGKVVVVDNLLDVDALPVPGDWYAQRVKAALGPVAFDRNFRLYFNESADHLDGPVTGFRATYLVNYYGAVEQSLRDVSGWVEHGVAPPRSTKYTVHDSQVRVPARASQRHGMQPVVDLTIRGRDRVDVEAGHGVTFSANVQVPPGTGKIVSTAWDFSGTGTFTPKGFGAPKATLNIVTRHRFMQPGTYYVALKVASSREGLLSPFGQVENLDRVRVVVHPATH